MNDMYGRPLSVDDRVIYVYTYGSGINCLKGKIVSFTPKMVRVLELGNAYGPSTVASQRLIKIDGIEETF